MAVLLLCVIWRNRYEVIFSVYGFFQSPTKPKLTEIQSDRIVLEYAPSDYLTKTKIQSIQKILTQRFESAEKETGIKFSSRINVYLLNNWEQMGIMTKHVPLAQIDPDSNTLYYIVNKKMDGTNERLEYSLLFHEKFGKPALPDGDEIIAAALGGMWNQKTLNDWEQFLRARGLNPQFPLFLTDNHLISPYITKPWNAILSRFIKEKFGWSALFNLYKTAQLPAGYQNQWNAYLNQLPRPDQLPEYHFERQFQKGISYAYANGYDSGYPTQKSQKSLDILKDDGVGWIAAIPYGFMPEENAPVIGFARSSIFTESDEGVFAVVDDARAREMKVMLKPQIWVRGSWTGNIQFQSDASWDRWFHCYENWIIHYAIIAELTKIDLFCIGTELVETTLQKPDDWKRLILKIRNVYHGPIVYASNWGKEFEQIAFWSELDYIGLDNYYPVRDVATQDSSLARKAFEKQKEKIREVAMRLQKPVLFTEIGFVASDGAGMGPRESDYPSYNEQVQAEYYRLTFETYWNEPWFCGMYWWKWFSDPDDRGRNADRHSPSGRPAELVMKEWYQKETTCCRSHTIQ